MLYINGTGNFSTPNIEIVTLSKSGSTFHKADLYRDN